MRAPLLAAAAAAALIVPIAVWDTPAPRPAPPRTSETPDGIMGATSICSLLGCPMGKSCDINRLKVTVVVGRSALRVESNWAHVPTIARDGGEWQKLRAALRQLDLDPNYRDLMLRVEDDAAYEDLLAALAFSREAGFSPLVVHRLPHEG
jgi:hypothetical protein